MSAICGVVGTDGRPFAAGALAGVMRALEPFGPDAGGTWAGSAGDVGVALGGRGVAQPLRSADGTLCLVADALLDCRAELLAALRAPTDASDPRLILAAYERWGDRCLERFSGDFAFALSDSGRGGVLVARDQLGIRPLQVHRRRGVVAFASTALSLCALEGVGHGLDRLRVGEWLALQLETERTFVAGVTTLPPGHCAWIDTRGLRRRRYWTLDPDRIVELDSPAAYAAELRDVFDSAVERRLPRGEPAGVMLSGGLDSTSVAATAARLRPRDTIRTYTAAPPEGWSGPTAPGVDADESALVRELAARHPNLAPAFVGDHGGPLLASLDARFAAGSPPPRNPCNELWMVEAQARAAADGVRTLLTGSRGNAFFSGDDPVSLTALRAWPRELARQLLPPPLHRVRGLVRARRAGISADDELRFTGPAAEAVVRQHARAFDPVPRRATRDQALRLVATSGFIAESGAVRDALLGARRSDPTSDIRVIAVCATQPAWARRRGGRTRAVCRDAMADRLPPSIAERTRRGAQLPDWLDRFTPRRGELVDELAAAREHGTCRELLDLDRIDAALRDWPDASRLRAQFARTTLVYRYDLARALLMCRYLRFFEAHAAEARHR